MCVVEWNFCQTRRVYKSKMQLNMTIMSAHDYGDYHCVSKNELGTTRGIFHVQGAHRLLIITKQQSELMLRLF